MTFDGDAEHQPRLDSLQRVHLEEESIMRLLFTLTLLLAASVSRSEPAPANPAVEHPDRPTADRSRDAGRRPADILRFMQIQPGQTVLDLFAGGGYYTELLAHQVGSEGRVISHNNQAYLDYARDELETRFAEGRLANVTRLTSEANDLALEPESIDRVMMVLAYHDLYFEPGNGSWPNIDGPALLETLCQALRPSGILGVIDHVAAAGSPQETGNTLHRIDPELARTEIEASGCFRLDASSDVLRNPEDDLARPMNDPQVRGRTDRFVFRFIRLPAAESADQEPR